MPKFEVCLGLVFSFFTFDVSMKRKALRNKSKLLFSVLLLSGEREKKKGKHFKLDPKTIK